MMCSLVYDALYRCGQRVLEPARLVFPEAGCIGVIGANGAGKTTLFLALANRLLRRNGSAQVTSGAANAPLTTCFMAQRPALPEWSTVRDAMSLYTGAEHDEALTEALLLRNLLARRVGTLSGGELQAVNLAAVIGCPGEALVLDEPFAHLDFRRRVAAIGLLASHTPSRRLTLISSQSAADLAPLCSHYLVLARQRAVFSGSLDDLVGTAAARADDRLSILESRLIELLDDGAIVGTG